MAEPLPIVDSAGERMPCHDSFPKLSAQEPSSEPIRPRTLNRRSGDKSHDVPGLNSIVTEKEPSRVNDPARPLIVQRLNLIDDLCFNRTKLSGDDKNLHLTSLVSRITASGRIKPGDELTHIRATMLDIMESGDARRAGLNRGNRRCSAKGQYGAHRRNDKEPQPRAILRAKLMRQSAEGLKKARTLVREVGFDFITRTGHGGEPDGASQRTYPGGLSYKEVFTTLRMFRNSQPADYAAALAKEQRARYYAQREKAGRYLEAPHARTPAPSPSEPPSILDTKRFSTLSNDSDVSFSSFASEDTFGAGVKKAMSVASKITGAVRKKTAKIPGLHRLRIKPKSGIEDLRGEYTAAAAGSEVTPSSFPETERGVEALQEKLDNVSLWINGLGSPLKPDQNEPECPLAELSADVTIQHPATSSRMSDDLTSESRHCSTDTTSNTGLRLDIDIASASIETGAEILAGATATPLISYEGASSKHITSIPDFDFHACETPKTGAGPDADCQPSDSSHKTPWEIPYELPAEIPFMLPAPCDREPISRCAPSQHLMVAVDSPVAPSTVATKRYSVESDISPPNTRIPTREFTIDAGIIFPPPSPTKSESSQDSKSSISSISATSITTRNEIKSLYGVAVAWLSQECLPDEALDLPRKLASTAVRSWSEILPAAPTPPPLLEEGKRKKIKWGSLKVLRNLGRKP